MNLCVNARDALPEGGHIWIKARNIVVGKDAAPPVPDARPGRFVVLSVSDNGHGMSPETMASAFEPFYSTKDEGTGLGLSTLLGIVRGHQGFVEVESRLGFGTTFRVYLPAMHEPSRPGETKKARSPQKGRGDLILFVDDDEAYRLTMQAALSEQGFRVIVAQDGREGAALYRTYQDQIGVVITDLMMPVLDGAGLIEAVRALNASVPVVLISGGRGEEELADALRDQIVDFLGKPFEAHRLLETLHNVLG
jgi:CheY-like chemotaxis protein